MSDKGGEGDIELKDFEASMSAADEEARARVERAENGLIDEAIAERDGAHIERVYNAPSKSRLAVMTILARSSELALFLLLFFLRCVLDLGISLRSLRSRATTRRQLMRFIY